MPNYDRSYPDREGGCALLVPTAGAFTATGQSSNIVHMGMSSGFYQVFSSRTSATEPSVLTVMIQGRMGADAPWVELTSFTNASYTQTLDPTGTPVANAGAGTVPSASIYRLMPEMRAVTTGTWTGTGSVKVWVAWR